MEGRRQDGGCRGVCHIPAHPPASCILHPASCILHPASCILHPASRCILHPASLPLPVVSRLESAFAFVYLRRVHGFSFHEDSLPPSSQPCADHSRRDPRHC